MSLLYSIRQNQLSNEYTFVTKNGTTYEVYFLDSSGYFPVDNPITQHTFVFGFNTENHVPSFDIKVVNSIAQIVLDFFDQNPNSVLVYVYDQKDGKQNSRKRLFNKWFNYYSDNTFIKRDISLDASVHLAAIFKSENSERGNISAMLDEFKEAVDNK